MVSASLSGGLGKMSNTRIYWLHTLSPTHAGIGRGVGYIDLPIDRDGVTGWPIIRASAFKGVWADYYRATEANRQKETPDGRLLKAAFGIGGDDNSNAGALIPTDAKIVCLPVRSFHGTFAWATSPLVLKSLRRSFGLVGQTSTMPPPEVKEGHAHHASKTFLLEGPSIYLEDLDFRGVECSKANAWANWLAESVFDKDDVWRTEFQKRFVILPDNAFDFLCETGTEVHARVRIDEDNKTVVDGALWTEESLPAETILAGIIQCDRIYGRHGEEITSDTVLTQFANSSLILQIGGKATVGRGQVRCVFSEVNK